MGTYFDGATVICSQPKLDGVMLGNNDGASHMNHEQVVCAVKIWFTVVGTVDVVFYFTTAFGIDEVRLYWWYLGDGVVAGL
jgi:hypothetical protein